MLEILLLIALCKKMGSMMRAKGYEKPFWFQFFVPVCWFGGEVAGAIIYAVLALSRGGSQEGFDFMGYVAALIGAGVGAGVIFLIANSFARRPQLPPAFPG
ncbi:MAG TPA: hypothetical protein VGO11_16660 [Chthoniobacteraceae bacterium]|jgi:hypothetical protein|nr:hypothetical protein [Chthoniobacteraceae bacterium]